MKTWSIESAFVRVCAAAAVAVQGVLDAWQVFGGAERLAEPALRETLDMFAGSFWCKQHRRLTCDCPEDCATKVSRAGNHTGADAGSNAPASSTAGTGPSPGYSMDEILFLDFTNDLADAIGDNYDHDRNGAGLPLYWEDDINLGFDFTAVARELACQYDIRRK